MTKKYRNELLAIQRDLLVAENDKLRALLKECKPYVSFKINQNKRIGFTPNDANLLDRIKAVISESESED